MTEWGNFSREQVRALAPDAVDSFRTVVAAVGTAYDVTSLELVRRRVSSLLSVPFDVLPELTSAPPATSPDLDGVAAEFAEQFVLDVAGITSAARQQLGEVLGASTFPFVQAVYVLDQVARLSAVVRQVFGASPFDVPATADAGELWPAM
jgi:hypothetical protein